MEPSHTSKPWFPVLVVANLVMMCTVFFFNAATPSLIPGIFQNTVGNQSRKYELLITPSGWTFSIWGIIYAWQAAWIVYSLVNLCRKTPSGPAYCSPGLLTPMYFVFFMLANCCNIAWLFLFDRDVIPGAFVALLSITVFLAAALVTSYRTLDDVSPALAEQGRTADIWLVRGLVHNGLGIYATWCSIATLLNLAMVITYESDPKISNVDACTVSLCCLGAIQLVYGGLDLLKLDRYSRYTLTPYFVVVVALIGSMTKNWQDGARLSVITAVLLALGAASLVLKIVMTLYRHQTRTRYTKHHQDTLDGYKGGQAA